MRLDEDEGRCCRAAGRRHDPRFCDGKITHFKIPRYVVAADEFPITVTGEIRKVRKG